MPFQDFREFLGALRKHGELIDIDRPVALELEVAKALRKSASVGGPACVFKNNGTRFPLVAGVYNTRAKALTALEATEDTIFERILSGLAKRIPPVIVKDAPVHENVITGDAIDLSALPVPKYSPDDGGPYITPGIVVSRDPETGIPDIGHYRFEIIDKTTMSFNPLPLHRLGKHVAKARALGHTTYRAAVVIGVDPILAYTAPIQVHEGTNDFELAGGLRGAPIELVQAKTVDLDVPARAEFVIEFEADLTKTVMEGPLGEYTGYYSPAALQPVARVLAITHRNDACFQGLLTGVPPTENHILKQVPYEASFLAMMRQQFPTLSKVSIPSSGGVSYRIVMAMQPRFAGEARSALLAAIASNFRPKMVVVVDPDIDVHSSAEVEWAMAFRTQPARDAVIVDGLPGGPLDPMADESLPATMRTGSAIGIDATFPFGLPVRKAGEAAANVCGQAVAEHGREYIEVADVPGWKDYDFPELRKRAGA